MKASFKLLIDLDQVKLPLPKRIGQLLLAVAKNTLGVNKLNRYYSELEIEENFYESTLKKLNIDFDIESIETIPSKGGMVILANHPFGAVEGVILGAYLSRIRPDFKFIGNGLLQMIDEMREDVIAVNPFGNKASIDSNAKGLRDAIRWVKEGHVLVVFPAGEVSSFRLRHLKIEDPKWSKHIGWLVKRTEAPVLPLYFNGSNSMKFQALGLLHPILRTMRLPIELLNKSGTCTEVQTGRLIHYKTYKEFDEPQVLIDYFRHQTYALARKIVHKERPMKLESKLTFQNIVEPISRNILCSEIESLEQKHLLLERGKFKVYATKSECIPNVLHEIGRLREITFRAAGEGTGKTIDIDRYDPYYTQLFLWDREVKSLIGSCRLGHTKEILEQHGPQGMYSSSLFKVKKRYWDTLSLGLEMGRSFIVKEYQKSPICLPLLWHGICQYLVKHPPYHSLYGCVSICSEYQRSSIDLMIDYLQKFRPALKGVEKVKPRMRHIKRQRHLRTWLDGLDPIKMNPEQLSQMISMLEPDGKGIPVLLRHYLKAGSKVLCFNVDPDFSDVVDALILVDLYKTESKLIEKFLKIDDVSKLSKASNQDSLSLA